MDSSEEPSQGKVKFKLFSLLYLCITLSLCGLIKIKGAPCGIEELRSSVLTYLIDKIKNVTSKLTTKNLKSIGVSDGMGGRGR